MESLGGEGNFPYRGGEKNLSIETARDSSENETMFSKIISNERVPIEGILSD